MLARFIVLVFGVYVGAILAVWAGLKIVLQIYAVGNGAEFNQYQNAIYCVVLGVGLLIGGISFLMMIKKPK